MKTKILLLLTLLIVLVGVASASEVSNETLDTTDADTVAQDTSTYVQESVIEKSNEKEILREDENTGTTSKIYDVSDFNSLHSALSIDEYDIVTINIQNDIILGSSTTLNQEIKNLTINGNEKTINGNNNYQFLYINLGQSVTIENIIIRNCTADEGGAIYNNGNLIINNSLMNNNIANDYGGAIYSNEGTVTVLQSTLTNNMAEFCGGAIFLGSNNLLDVNNSVFSNNTAEWNGGAIYGFDGNNYANINNSVFINNTNPTLRVANTLTNTTLIQDKFHTRVSVVDIDLVKIGDEVTIQGYLEGMDKWDNWNSLSDMNITIKINDKEYHATTDFWGEYHFDYITEVAGINNVTILYEGNPDYYNTSTEETFEVEKVSTRVRVFDINSVKMGNEVTIEGYLEEEYDGLSDMDIIIIINGEEYPTTTNDWGYYQLVYIPTVLGTNNITVIYKGNDYYNNATINTTFEATRTSTIIDMYVYNIVKLGSELTIAGYLEDIENWNSLSNMNITIIINEEEHHTTTNDWGYYQLVYVPTVLGTNNITVIYKGNEYYDNATIQTTFEVDNKDESYIYLDNIRSTILGENITISGTLNNEEYAISNSTVILDINGELFYVTTNEYGNFSIEYTTNIVGTNNITACFEGNDYYRSSTYSKNWIVYLNYELSLNIEYDDTTYGSDEINITGVLTNNSKPYENANINILIQGYDDNWNNIILLNTNIITDENGIYTLKYTPVASYNYPSITASFIDEIEDKHTQYKLIKNPYSLTLNVNNYNPYYIGENVEITGKLTYKNENLANKSINLSIYEENSQQKILDIPITTNENGSYSHTYQVSNNLTYYGSYKIKISFNDLNKYANIILVNKTIENTNIINVNTYNELLNAVESIKHMTTNNLTINLLSGYYNATGTIIFDTSFKNKNIMINGNDNTLNGKDAYQFIQVYSNITLENIILRNFDASNIGAISNYGNLIIKNCTFENNHAEYGGAIYSTNELTISNSYFINNTATYGGAISNDGNLIIKNCTFENNHAEYGGAIYSTNELTISNSYFINNTATYGGAIYVDTILSSLINGEFIDNTATYGGAIYGNISNSSFNGNFIGNTADMGGAIYGNISNSLFDSNFENTKGGVIYGNIRDSIFNGNFINNSAERNILSTTNILSASAKSNLLSFASTMNAGAITGNVIGSTFNGNFIANTADIGAVIKGNVDKSVFTGKITENNANEGVIVSGITYNSVFSSDIDVDSINNRDKLFGNLSNTFVKNQNYADTNATVIDDEDDEDDEYDEDDLEIDLKIYVDKKITNKPIIISIYINDPVGFILDKTITCEHSDMLKDITNPLIDFLEIFDDEDSSGDITIEIRNLNNLKDAISLANYFKTNSDLGLTKGIIINDVTILIAPGVYRGANNIGLKIYADDLTLMNDAQGDVIIDAENNGSIFTVYPPRLNIKGLIFMHASNSAIIFENGLFDCVINANFVDNYNKEGAGGAIYCKGDIKNVEFNGNFINNNGSGGGAIYCYEIHFSIFNCDFINNYAKYRGGAIACNNIISSIFNGNFINNNGEDYITDGSRVSYGGAIGCYELISSTFNGNFINNTANYGGAIDGDISNSNFNGNFINNYASLDGGAIMSVDISYSTFNGDFIKNYARRDGGAIDCSDLGRGKITSSTFNGNFIGNTAKMHGSAIDCYELISSIFNGNFIGNNASYGDGPQPHDNITSITFNRNFLVYNVDKYSPGSGSNFMGGIIDGNIKSSTINGKIIGNTRYALGHAYYINIIKSNIEKTSQVKNVLGQSLNDIYVDQSVSVNGDGSLNNPFNNLKSAIEQANDGSNIYIASGIYVDEDNVGLTINKSLNLIKHGNGDVIFDAKNNGIIFNINVASFNITGLTFVNATDSAITFNRGLMNSKIESNFKNNKNKSALYVKGIISNSIITGNYSNNTANNNGVAIKANNIINTFLNVNFINNIASNSGAIAGNIISSIINGNFINNTADNGGVIFGNIMNSVLNATFSNNTAKYYGGAIFGNISKSNVTCNFIKNKAINGGVIYGSVSSSNINNGFMYNQATNGGVIYGSISNSNFTLNFMNNNASKGSIVFTDNHISASVFDGEFLENTADVDYGKLFYATGTISDCKFLGEIFVSNLDSINTIMYSAKSNPINCIFNSSTNESGVLQPIDEENINISLDGNVGESIIIKLPDDASGNIMLYIDGEQYVFTVVNGVVNVTIPKLASGTYGYIINYLGNDKYLPFSKTGLMNVKNTNKINTKVSISVSNSTPIITDNITITATLTDEHGTKLTNQKITLTIDNKTYNLTTNSNGIVTLTYTLTKIGTQEIIAIFDGNMVYDKVNATKTFIVNKKDTIITLDSIPTTQYSNKLIISGKFMKNTGEPLKNATIILKINDVQYNTKTDANGSYALNYTVTKVGVNNITATFSGNSVYNKVNVSKTFTVTKKDTKITINISSTQYSNKITISGRFTRSSGEPLKNATIILKINDVQYNTKTDANGSYALNYTVTKVGVNNITATFSGNSVYNKVNVSKTFTVNNIFHDELNIFINSMNILNGKYVLTTKVSDGSFNKLNVGRVSYRLDGTWIGSINVVNGSSWISFNVPSIGNHTIVATYINPNGSSVASDTYTFEKKAGVNALFNTYNVKNGKVIVITNVKYDNGNNINSGRVSYSLNGKWIGSIDVKNGSSWINFNYNDTVVTFKATFITKNNVTQNIYTRTLNLTKLKALVNQTTPNQNNNTQPLKNSSVHIMINSMNVLNSKYVLTTKVTDKNYVNLTVGRVSYTLDGKWIGSVNVTNGSSWISFDTPSTGNHTIVATYLDKTGKAITTDTYTFEKRTSTAGVNSLFNAYNVKNGKVTIVTAVKNDKGNNINSGRISYSVNGKWIGSVNVTNGSSWINFNYTNTTVTFQATFITNSGVTQNIYTRTLDLDEIAKLKQA